MGIERIAIIDDMLFMQKHIAELLADYGFKGEVKCFSGQREMDKHKADCYFIDGLNGMWRYVVESAQRNNPDAKIILMSSEPNKYNGDLASGLGERYPGMKFNDKGDLLNIIEELLKP
jgi:hypothetical protein